jgi:WD40 repeat protein/serine/threonine protein kinase
VNASEREDRLNEILLAYAEAAEAGSPFDRSEFLSAHAAFTAELTEFFANQDEMEGITAPLRSVAQAVWRRKSQEGETPAPGGGGETTLLLSPFLSGERFGDYELLGEIGRGGMGVVYKARQRSLNRLVAIKMIRASAIASPTDLQRFRNEAEAAAQLDHPNIVPIYEIGEFQAGGIGPPITYFSMKLIDGPNLAEGLYHFRHDPSAAARLLTTIARAIHHAHEHGILHRDLKPSNILLRHEESGARETEPAAGPGHTKSRSALAPDVRPPAPPFSPLITDFGLAKRLTDDSSLTQPGEHVGTPSYMPPEQASRFKQPLTTAADVYGLGAVLYAMLTGRPPFHGDTIAETMRLLLETEPVLPRRLNQKVDADLETICLKCLEKDSCQRYPSAAALADDLERWLAGKPIQARAVGRTEQVWRWCKRRPAIAGLTAASVALLVMLLVGLAVSTALIARKAAEARGDRDLARQSERSLRRQLYVPDIARAHAAWSRCDLTTVLKTLARHIPAEGEPDLRGFEWFHLWALANQPTRELHGHKREVCHVAYSPDGKRLASCSWDGTIKIWDPANEMELRTLREHDGEVNCVTFSPDGKTLASAGDDRTVRLWDVESGENQRTLTGHEDDVMAVEFSPDGKLIASGGADKIARLWDRASGRLVATLVGHTNRIDSLAFREAGKTLVTGGRDGVARFWDVMAACSAPWPSAHAPIRSLPMAKGQNPENQPRITSIGCHGDAVAFGCADRHVRVSKKNETTAVVWPEQVYSVRSVRWSRDGSLLASGNEGGQIKLVDNVAGHTRVLQGQGRIWSLDFSPSKHQLASACGDGTVRVWDLSSPAPERRLLKQISPGASCLAFSPDGQTLLTGHRNGAARLWNVQSGQVAQEICPSDGGAENDILSASWSPDGRILALGRAASNAILWDVMARRRLPELAGENGAQQQVAFSPDGKLLATGGTAQALHLWNTKTWSLMHAAVNDVAGRLAFSPDGRAIAVAHYEASVLDVATGAKRFLGDTGRDAVRCLAYSADGGMLLVANEDGTLTEWDLGTGQDAVADRLHIDRRLDCGVLTPDGKTLITGGSDGILSFWNLVPCQELFHQQVSVRGVQAVAVSPDGTLLAIAVAHDESTSDLLLWSARVLDPVTKPK